MGGQVLVVMASTTEDGEIGMLVQITMLRHGRTTKQDSNNLATTRETEMYQRHESDVVRDSRLKRGI
jgi:hypothetical protein